MRVLEVSAAIRMKGLPTLRVSAASQRPGAQGRGCVQLPDNVAVRWCCRAAWRRAAEEE